ncbi:hypothetical protein FB567DRAFT_633394 [Paraphoma chrysanthemicola]|uniref:Uncharacterized protein n=1 Tax=Paraphoma chrysanthemicola TaxID=798071 RepID=A0A8K0QVE7_9PLEO|nr:hypothetical protein FB567DRAFT_633394 [Paraphoma chrysanthemicola]
MGLLTPFTSPTDPRWHGFQRHHHALFFIKSVILAPFIILVIVDYALFKSWWESGSYSYHKSWEYAPYQFWLRIGLALIPDIILTLIYLILILNPLHRSTYSLHPVFALVASICMLGPYATVCWLNPMIAMSNEVGFPNMEKWEQIMWAETGMQALLALMWIEMMIASCVAVHKWRKGRKVAGGLGGSGAEGELGRV